MIPLISAIFLNYVDQFCACNGGDFYEITNEI